MKSLLVAVIMVMFAIGCASTGQIPDALTQLPTAENEPTATTKEVSVQPLPEPTSIVEELDCEIAKQKITDVVAELRTKPQSKVDLAFKAGELSALQEKELTNLLMIQTQGELNGHCENNCPLGQPKGAGVGPVSRWLAAQLAEYGVETKLPLSYTEAAMEARGWHTRVYHAEIRELVYADCFQFQDPNSGHWYCPVDRSYRNDAEWWNACDCTSPPVSAQPLWPNGAEEKILQGFIEAFSGR